MERWSVISEIYLLLFKSERNARTIFDCFRLYRYVPALQWVLACLARRISHKLLLIYFYYSFMCDTYAFDPIQTTQINIHKFRMVNFNIFLQFSCDQILHSIHASAGCRLYWSEHFRTNCPMIHSIVTVHTCVFFFCSFCSFECIHWHANGAQLAVLHILAVLRSQHAVTFHMFAFLCAFSLHIASLKISIYDARTHWRMLTHTQITQETTYDSVIRLNGNFPATHNYDTRYVYLKHEHVPTI